MLFQLPSRNHRPLEEEPTPPERREPDYKRRGLIGLTMVGFGTLAFMSGIEVPQPSVEVAWAFTAGGLGSIAVGATLAIDSGIRYDEQSE